MTEPKSPDSETPTPFWEKADIGSKILLGIAGLLLTAVLAWGEYEERQRERAVRTAEASRLREESLAREFQTYYAMARQARPGDDSALSDLDLASSVAQTLAAPPFNRPHYNDAVLAQRVRLTPGAAGQGSAESGVSPVTLQARETRTAPSVTRSSEEWFAVIASYTLSPNGLRLATERARAVPRNFGCADVWRTILSRNYAVIVGGVTERASALANAQRARAGGLAQDAFTQANRQWVREVQCANGSAPITATRV